MSFREMQNLLILGLREIQQRMYLFLHGMQLNFETLCHRMAENKRGLFTTEETERITPDSLVLSTTLKRQALARENPALLLDHNLRVGTSQLLFMYFYRHC